MENFKIYNSRTVEKLIITREGETKFGEKIKFVEGFEQLKNIPAKYVLVGIPEDIGVRANRGKEGTAKAWHVALKSLLNVQSNRYSNAEDLILLGEIECREYLAKAENLGHEDPHYFEKMGDLVSQIDSAVTRVIEKIVSLGKIPIIIGGGHNNAYGNIKGSSQALKKPINILNIDAHTDLRRLEHRHSGNGFSYARKEGFLGKYRVFGVHQNYTPAYIFEQMDAAQNDQYRLFEHLVRKSSQQILTAFREELDTISQEEFGLELDVDAIRDFPSSAQTPSGFSFNMVRNFVALASEEENIKYIHICEAAPTANTEASVGKALSYFITDIISTGI
ncbi:formimidoylglutamase [Antarcticibacterium flavum]|uniref:Formimidoylglutamase n=1 Tax=Antarcticibacterium flavum TaxID=2058175 RepID=A0A5B7X8A5_9FLAO|nr:MULTISPECIES: formimidoylglutamase [Antarcticibacterium]MCM4159625.1 formimidoylglutamase [Antarcticibacterium sp. W02-3]QCY70871.1 formimidoylglutamase [Antarcticibacterium flavum]